MKTYTVRLNTEVFGQYDTCTDWKNGIKAALQHLRDQGYSMHPSISNASCHGAGFKDGKRVRVMGRYE